MRTTVTLDDELLEKAMNFTGIEGKSDLINKALRDLINREVASRFLALEGTMPDLEYADRGFRYGRSIIPSPVLNDSDE
jgi:Arc/MetJ family transcription regulator